MLILLLYDTIIAIFLSLFTGSKIHVIDSVAESDLLESSGND
jgi:hypothetical protein